MKFFGWEKSSSSRIFFDDMLSWKKVLSNINIINVTLSVCVFLLVCLPVHLCLFACMSLCQSVYLSVIFIICLSVRLSVCLFVCLNVCLSICICVSDRMSVCQRKNNYLRLQSLERIFLLSQTVTHSIVVPNFIQGFW